LRSGSEVVALIDVEDGDVVLSGRVVTSARAAFWSCFVFDVLLDSGHAGSKVQIEHGVVINRYRGGVRRLRAGELLGRKAVRLRASLLTDGVSGWT